jgi:hypothetical protein
MKNSDIFKTILSEASGRPLDEVTEMFEALSRANNMKNMEQDISDNEAATLLAQLRTELPGIRQWLIQGRFMAESQTGNC